MSDHNLPPRAADRLMPTWSWCARCQRVHMTGIYRQIRFAADALHPHPATLKLCPYSDCGASVLSQGWLWETVRLQHPEYPVTPALNVIYTR